MRNTTLCYVEKDGQYLMLHRVKKERDVNRDKWIGIGGGFLEDESPEDCILREALEETGLVLHEPKLRAVVTFVIEDGECEQMFLFKCDRFSGELRECDEGVLEFIDKDRLFELDIWEGDRFFLQRIRDEGEFFTMKLVYDREGRLLEASENGKRFLGPRDKA
ncbi:MAG: 8-oxo-dGTP diphosphatase [Clostridia bacterium]|nr:8-oxo-dGTP diphosphatase [Clostridia bacterium]